MASQRIRETYDKENPPHPLLSNKKASSLEEPPLKKKILGEPFQVQVIENEMEEDDPIGEWMMQRKRAFQEKRKQNTDFSMKLFEC